MSDNPNAIILLTPDVAVQRAKDTYQIVKTLREDLLTKDVDFGVIPGTDKPTLLKPGAEKLARAFGYCPVFEPVSKIERWEDESPLFHYEIRCRLVRIEDGKEIATGLGSCNSKENRYRWRWVEESDLPPMADKAKLKTRSSTRSEFVFAGERAETTGPYGRPAEYWNEWKFAVDDGIARLVKKKARSGKELDAWEMGGLLYRMANDEVFSLVNTIEKMATKRALIAAVLIAVGASEFFTQDLEDLRDFGSEVIEGNFVELSMPSIPPTPPSSPSPPPVPPPEIPWAKAAQTAFWTHWTAQSLTQSDILTALGIKALGEWTKSRRAADEAVRAYVEQQTAHSSAPRTTPPEPARANGHQEC